MNKDQLRDGLPVTVKWPYMPHEIGVIYKTKTGFMLRVFTADGESCDFPDVNETMLPILEPKDEAQHG